MPIKSTYQAKEAEEKRVSTATARQTDAFENTLRPKTLDEYIGQSRMKENLKVFVYAAKKRKECLEHTLLYGPPGLGKTTMASIIAEEMGGNFKVTSAPAIEKQGDLAAILTNLKENDILFIDEIHRLRPNIEEVLYSAMEDYCLDIMIGKGPSARTMRLNIPQFTLVGATTKYSQLSSPLRDRFGHIFKLEFYTAEEMQQIIDRSASILEYQIETEASKKIAKCSRRTPRVANRLLKRVRDFAEMAEGIPASTDNSRVAPVPTPSSDATNTITLPLTQYALKALGIDEQGLDRTDLNLIKTIIEKFQGGPVGLNTLSAATGEDSGTIEDVYEPYLIQLGMLDRSPRGRIATKHAYQHLGLSPKDVEQSQLL